MKEKDQKVFVASVKNVSSMLEVYGKADLKQINLLKLLYKYVEYCTTYEQLQRFDSMVLQLQRESKLICNEITASRGAVIDYVVPIIEVGTEGTNQPPVIQNNSIDIEGATTYTFTVDDLYGSYSDDGNGAPTSFRIKGLPNEGTLTYNSQPVVVDQVFTDPTLLVYTRSLDGAYNTGFGWSVFDDDAQLPLESNTATMSISTLEVEIPNQPPVVGDNNIYVGNRIVTPITIEMLTTDTVLPYFDIENNGLDAIRVVEVSLDNEGRYLYYGQPVAEGQVITAAEIELGAFVHEAADSNAVRTDVIRLEARDGVNLEWVE